MASKNQKISFLFYPNKQRTKKGEAQIYVRLYVDGKRAEFSTNFYIPLSDWDTKKFKVKNTHKSALLVNNRLEQIRSEINHLFVLEITQKGSTGGKEIRDKYLGRDVDQQPKQTTILEAFDYHNLKLSEQVKIGKVVQYYGSIIQRPTIINQTLTQPNGDIWKADKDNLQFFPVKVRRHGTNDPYFQLPYEPLISVSGKNNIIKRDIAKAPNFVGTVKEYWSQDDYEISITGTLLGENEIDDYSMTFPASDFEKLKMLRNQSSPSFVRSCSKTKKSRKTKLILKYFFYK